MGSTIRQRKILAVKLCFINVYTYYNLMVRSHQMRMKRYLQMIYMLSQCKDAIDNPAVLMAQVEKSEFWLIFTLRQPIRSSEVTWLRAEAENPKQQWRTNESWLYVGTRSCTILLRTFTKTGIHLATRLELPGRSPSHDAYSCLLCSEFHERMKRVNSKCSSVQLRANSAIYSLHPCLVWTPL